MTTQRRSLASRLFAGLGRVTWGVIRRKVDSRINRPAGRRDSGRTDSR